MPDIQQSWRSPMQDLMEQADITLYASEFVTYLGFCQPGTADTSAAKWAICRITVSGNTYPYTETVEWANGLRNRNLVFDDYDTFTYSFKKFE